MKKEYMQPTIEVVKIETTQMLADSLTSIEGADGFVFEGGGHDPLGREQDDLDQFIETDDLSGFID